MLLVTAQPDPAPLEPEQRVSAPQVLLGYPYNVAIDMWSLGCVAAELFLGLPLFPGASEHDLLTRVVEMMGPPPDSLLAAAKHTKKFFHRLDVTEVSPSGEPRALLEIQTHVDTCPMLSAGADGWLFTKHTYQSRNKFNHPDSTEFNRGKNHICIQMADTAKHRFLQMCRWHASQAR